MPSVRKRDEILVYQIKITLKETAPPVWRRILVPSDIHLDKLHRILQVVMGWYNAHLHQFTIGKATYGVPHPDYEFEMRDESRVTLGQIVTGEGFRFEYEYDFGDSWIHTLLVEKELMVDRWQQLPVCLEGRRAGPPEDVGGVWGYHEFLEAIADPDHDEHEKYLQWIGGEYDPDEFDLKVIDWGLAVLL